MPQSQTQKVAHVIDMQWPAIIAGLLLLVGVTASGALALYQQQLNQQQIHQHLDAAAKLLIQQTTERVTLYQYGLRGMRGVVLTADAQLRPELIRQYMQTRSLPEEFPGAHGFGFIRRVPVSAEANFLADAQRQQPGFRIKQLTPHNAERYVIQYIEPQPRNHAAVGLDIASELHRRHAAEQAMRSGQTRLTAPITLVQASGKSRQSFLMLMPIYSSWQVPDRETERVGKLIGWSYAPLIMEEMLAGLPMETQQLHLGISDITDNPVLFYQLGQVSNDAPIHITVEQEVFGRRWQWQVQPGPAFIAALKLPSPQLLALSGILLTLLLMLSLFSGWRVLQSRRLIHDQRSRLAAIVQSSNDGIIGNNLQGVVTSWNQGAEKIFGYSADEAIGHKLSDLIVPAHLLGESLSILQQLSHGNSVKQFITQRVNKQGKLLDVLVNISPVYDEKGRIVSAAKTVRDIGELVASRRQLDQALRQYKTLLDTINTQFLYAETDPDGRILDVNSVFSLSHGYSKTELIGQTHRMLKSGVHPPVFWRQVWQQISNKMAWRGEICNLNKNGQQRWYDTVIMPLLTAGGQIERYIALSSDITDRKEAEAQRQRLHQLIETVLSAASEVAIISLDAEGKINLFNRGAEQMLGYLSGEMAESGHWQDLLPRSESKRYLFELGMADTDPDLLLRHVAATGTPETWRTELCCQDGSRLPVLLTLTAIRDSDCQLLGYLLIALDFSQQLQNQADMAILKDQLSIAASVAQLGVWTWHPQTNALWWNDRMFSIYEQPMSLSADGLVYQHWRERVHPDDLAATEQQLQAALYGEAEFSPVFRIITPERGVRYVLSGATVEFAQDGTPWRVTGINLDITEQRELEQQLRQAKEQADAANLAKSQFLASMSHEIRTPLNAVLGLLQLMHQTPLNDLQADYVDKSQLAARSLLSLLNNILDFSKIDAGKLELDPAPLALEEFFRQLAVLLGAIQQNRQVELLFELDPAMPETVLADAQRLQQVLLNLGGNALKFTEQGYVRIQLEVQSQDAQQVQLRFAVSDSGIGISESQRSRLFGAFSQAEASISRRYGGSGLGLAISQRLLHLMHAELQLNSELGVGSCFSFSLSLPVLAPAVTEQLPAGLRLLLVDDQPLVRQSLALTLQQAGATVDVCESGEQALQQAAQAQQQGLPYQLVLLDWQMPGLDGVATGRQLREQSSCPPQLLMVTAFESEVLREISAMDREQLTDILIKPVTPAMLLQAVRRALQPAPTASRPVLERPQSLLGLHLLVVEDNALNRQVAEQLLLSAGARVSLAVDGFMAVALVQQQFFDLVLMDLQMPGMDGLTACRQIREQFNSNVLPILAMTANATPEDKAQCLAAGMNAHVSKPIDLDTLVPLILQWSRRSANAPMPASASKALGNSPALLAPLESVLQRFTNNVPLLRQSLQQFERQWRCDFQEFCSQVDSTRQRAILHDLQGVAATLGMPLLADSLRHAGSLLKAGATPDCPALAVLAERSIKALYAVLSQQQAEAMTSASPVLSDSQVRLLLQQRHLAALDFAGALPATESKFTEVKRAVDALDFDAALAALQSLKERMTDAQ